MGARSVEGGLMPGARLDKVEVNYRQHQKCSVCDHYYPSGTCAIVEGNISPDNVCDRWEIASQKTKYRDKDFFRTAFEKENRGVTNG